MSNNFCITSDYKSAPKTALDAILKFLIFPRARLRVLQNPRWRPYLFYFWRYSKINTTIRFRIKKSTTMRNFKPIIAKTGELWGKNRLGEYPLICGFLKTSFLQNCCQKKSFSTSIFQILLMGMVLNDRYLDFAHLLWNGIFNFFSCKPGIPPKSDFAQNRTLGEFPASMKKN